METLSISPWLLYLILQLDDINKTISVFTFAFGMITIFYTGFYIMSVAFDEKETSEKFKVFRFYVYIPFFIIVTLATLVPSTKTFMIAFGVPYILENVQQIDGVNKLPSNFVGALNRMMEDFQDKETKD